ncbi:DUF262 domain-containing protein [Pseudonocardia sp.]|uniref:DUF262 domain-containing protein n=1 Tax=Pseudonocardia sp. TaxID=60912 RepID=UPI0025F8777C|nr:DUF262 domain-containing protein [Pseudonocardia sp.]
MRQLFSKDVRYVVPRFQRSYVWNQEDQWEPLWDDVRNTAERYLEVLDSLGGDIAEDGPKAAEQVERHFMGAVVLQQRPNAVAELETRDVIDGQQRLTTMQLLADAAQQVTEEDGFAQEAKRLRRLVLNREVEGDDEFKLWPTQLDREAFRAAMRNGDEDLAFEGSAVAQAHAFFRLQVREWIAAADSSEERTRLVHGLETTLFTLLQLVVIDLSTTDDATVIFETLNARGTPLRESDLIKNYILQEATSAGQNPDSLHDEYWSRLEDSWWQKDIRQGRLYRPRLDTFLGHWLVMRTASEVQAQNLFDRFRKYVKDGDESVANVVADVVHVGASYRMLESPATDKVLERFLYRWKVIDAGVATPVLLWLFSQPGIDPGARVRAWTAIESFLVRRMVCRLTTKDYNRVFIDLVGRLKDDPVLHNDAVVTYLADQEADARQWPDDRQLQTAFTELPLYRLLTLGRLRMVLEAIEESLRTSFTESSEVSKKLTIEHILPRAWPAHWAPPAGEDAREATAQRSRLLHSIGNLTLITGKLNASQSNGPWEKKQAALNDHSVLYLNKRLLIEYGGQDWDEAGIRARGIHLAKRASRIWPSAAAMIAAG